jgi:hypothetical protein
VTTRRYLELDLPARFELQVREEDGSWSTFAVAAGEDFELQPDGSYVCAGGGRPIFLRVVEVRSDYFVHVDGARDRFDYRIKPR